MTATRKEPDMTTESGDRPSRLRWATFPDGSQILITDWPNGQTEVAKRRAQYETWGPPVLTEDR